MELTTAGVLVFVVLSLSFWAVDAAKQARARRRRPTKLQRMNEPDRMPYYQYPPERILNNPPREESDIEQAIRQRGQPPPAETPDPHPPRKINCGSPKP